MEVDVVSTDETSYRMLGPSLPSHSHSKTHILNLAVILCGMNTMVEHDHYGAS